MARAGLTGFTGHNLRDTFATLVTEESGDLTLAMQLIRDRVPGVASRYVKRDLPALLERYSPIRQLGGKPPPQVGESGVLVGESLVETGESRTPRPKGPLVGYATGLFGDLCLTSPGFRRRNLGLASRVIFGCYSSALQKPHPGILAPASPPPGLAVSRRSRPLGG